MPKVEPKEEHVPPEAVDDLSDVVHASPEVPDPKARDGHVAIDTMSLLRVWQMAKVGMHYGKWRPTRTMATAYRKVKEILQREGAVPS